MPFSKEVKRKLNKEYYQQKQNKINGEALLFAFADRVKGMSKGLLLEEQRDLLYRFFYIHKILEKREGVKNCEFRIISNNGGDTWASVHFSRRITGGGQP